jgi:hypothetical protein
VLAVIRSPSNTASPPARQASTSHGSTRTVCAAATLSGYTASTPQATRAASAPRCRTSSPARAIPAALASVVRIRPAAIPQAVPATLPASAAGTISKVIPGGCTSTKARYGSAPSTSRTALPKYGPSSYSVTPSR